MTRTSNSPEAWPAQAWARCSGPRGRTAAMPPPRSAPPPGRGRAGRGAPAGAPRCGLWQSTVGRRRGRRRDRASDHVAQLGLVHRIPRCPSVRIRAGKRSVHRAGGGHPAGGGRIGRNDGGHRHRRGGRAGQDDDAQPAPRPAARRLRGAGPGRRPVRAGHRVAPAGQPPGRQRAAGPGLQLGRCARRAQRSRGPAGDAGGGGGRRRPPRLPAGRLRAGPRRRHGPARDQRARQGALRPQPSAHRSPTSPGEAGRGRGGRTDRGPHPRLGDRARRGRARARRHRRARPRRGRAGGRGTGRERPAERALRRPRRAAQPRARHGRRRGELGLPRARERERAMTARFVLAVDQGTTATRSLVGDRGGRMVAVRQREHRQYFPRPGWVEHDPMEIWANTQRTAAQVLADVSGPGDVVALGIANQRETTVVWDRHTGRPVIRALVWQDARADELVTELAARPDAGLVAERSGMAIAGYFSGPRLRWILDHVPRARERAARGELLFGTMEAWLIWALTGGPDGGVRVTDVTNASRTLLMDVRTCRWDPELRSFFGFPAALLPEIRPSVGVLGVATALSPALPIAGALGDQLAALFGQACDAPGEAKCTYGAGSFLLQNTGTELVRARSGSISTVAYQLAGEPVRYALEGSVAVAGALVQWLRDGLGLNGSAAEVETLARTVSDNGGCYVVPAFSGQLGP